MTDKTEAQPEALELADRLIGNAEIDECEGCNPVVVALERAAATELCRQHAEIQQLKALLSARQAAPTGLTEAVFQVLEGWNIPAPVRKILETAYYAPPPPEREPHPPTRHCMCADCAPSFQGATND